MAGKKQRHPLYVLFLLLMLLMLALGVYLLVVGCQQGNPPVPLAQFSPQIIGGFFRHVWKAGAMALPPQSAE